jgi:hypothetical protein
MSSQESRCRQKVLLFDGWPNNYSISNDVRSEATLGDRPACGVENAGSNLYRQHGFQFYQDNRDMMPFEPCSFRIRST